MSDLNLDQVCEDLDKLREFLVMHGYIVGFANQGSLKDVLDTIQSSELMLATTLQLKAIHEIRWSSLCASLARTLKMMPAIRIAFSKKADYRMKYRNVILPELDVNGLLVTAKGKVEEVTARQKKIEPEDINRFQKVMTEIVAVMQPVKRFQALIQVKCTRIPDTFMLSLDCKRNHSWIPPSSRTVSCGVEFGTDPGHVDGGIGWPSGNGLGNVVLLLILSSLLATCIRFYLVLV